MATISSESFTKSTAQTRREKGPLVRVELGPGRYVKMHRADVEAKELTGKVHPADKDKLKKPAGEKSLPPQGDKVSPPQGDKAAPPESTPEPFMPDDFTAIDGVGKATARALVAHKIMTFEQLKAAGSLDYITPAAMAAIEAWRNG
jgi:predicted flap endonuclease-1-like 5' DNA nuclease